MNIETIHRHLNEINKLVDILDTRQTVGQTQTNTRVVEAVVPVPDLPNPQEVKTIQAEVLSATSISPQTPDKVGTTPQNISALRDVMIPGTHVAEPEVIPIHMNGGGKISRDKPKSEDIYYTISILDLGVSKTS